MRLALLALLASQLLLADHTPQLLLNAKLLRRLKRDHDRQTPRWVNFETRVKNVPDSPERGFELALYFAITNDEETGKQAVVWANSHPCELRQRMLIADWVGEIAPASCPAVQPTADPFKNGMPSPEELYKFVENLTIERDKTGHDIRNTDPEFFRNLPVQFLLSLKPDQVEHPTWMTHIAALALVSVDPNLQSSQFLQAWAMEDRQTLREGPGVAYELLWADPYLPGIAYQNLDPWIYDDENSRLYARSDWTPNACWIEISKNSVQNLNCPQGWRDQQVHFGTLSLIPWTGKCLEIPHQQLKQNLLFWHLTPGQTITYVGKRETSVNADAAGMWRPSANVEGKVCRR